MQKSDLECTGLLLLSQRRARAHFFLSPQPARTRTRNWPTPCSCKYASCAGLPSFDVDDSSFSLQACTMTALAEWGDRSQIATIVLGAREVLTEPLTSFTACILWLYRPTCVSVCPFTAGPFWRDAWRNHWTLHVHSACCYWWQTCGAEDLRPHWYSLTSVLNTDRI